MSFVGVKVLLKTVGHFPVVMYAGRETFRFSLQIYDV